jgi:uracil-DNA glycosylase family 4
MLWAQNPGRHENAKELELVGDSGRLLWRELRKVGLTRADFDIQNVVRCWTVKRVGGRLEEHSPPTPEELRCCSVYNHEALAANGGSAKVHLVLGKVAAVQLLSSSAKKGMSVFWHEPWNAYVVCADHPAYLLRQGSTGWAYDDFRLRLRAVRAILEYPGRWGYVKAQGYEAVQDCSDLAGIEESLHGAVARGEYIGVDIEDGVVGGRRVLLMIAFAWGHFDAEGVWKGRAVCVPVDHPENRMSNKVRHKVKQWLCHISSDPQVPKVMHHGSYDCRRILELLGIKVRGYQYDSQYAAYLFQPQRREYGLAAVAQWMFPEFSDYKTMVPEGGNFAKVPLKTLALYNCADADLSCRVLARVTA